MQPDKIVRFLIVALAASWIGLGSSPAHAQSDAQIAQMIKDTGFTYKTHSKNTWSIDFDRKKIGKVRVIISTGSDIVVTFAILAKKAVLRKTPAMLETLLTANHDYDYAKIGLDKDGDLFVRIDANLRLVDSKELKNIIEQVANASGEVFTKVSGSIRTETPAPGAPGTSRAAPDQSRAAPGK